MKTCRLRFSLCTSCCDVRYVLLALSDFYQLKMAFVVKMYCCRNKRNNVGIMGNYTSNAVHKYFIVYIAAIENAKEWPLYYYNTGSEKLIFSTEPFLAQYCCIIMSYLFQAVFFHFSGQFSIFCRWPAQILSVSNFGVFSLIFWSNEIYWFIYGRSGVFIKLQS